MARRTKVPALVGRVDAAQILGVHPNNIMKVRGLPDPLPGTGPHAEPDPAGMAVRATPLWPREQIESLAASRT